MKAASVYGKVNSMITKIQKQRGNISEARVFSALYLLLKSGFIKHFIYSNQKNANWIVKKLDNLGIDFIVILPNGAAKTLQVKSSNYGKKEFIKKRPDLSEVEVIQVNGWEDTEETLEKVTKILFENETIEVGEIIKRAADVITLKKNL